MKHLQTTLMLRLAILVLATFPVAGNAITIHALYTASCRREIGIIVGTDDRHVQMLNLDGTLATVNRFEVIYHATYPIDTTPVREARNMAAAPKVKIWTFQGGELRPLLTGWPVDFSQDKVSFLSLSGSEVVIDRTSIWKIDLDRTSTDEKFDRARDTNIEFVHPYAFVSCPQNSSPKATKIFPQQLLSDPVTIKREFDRLAEGHRRLAKYITAQKFYPIPEVYTNQTSLGLWLSGGSRYGASSNRKNNFTPLLIDEQSSGPFGFQSEFRTGSGPISQSIHEEPQTQVYYRFKADYFHMSLMADPNLLLVGSKYKYNANDMGAYDIRAVDSTFVEMGFDYGAFALELYVARAVNQGARYDTVFNQSNLSMGGLGLRVQGNTWTATLLGGSGQRDGSQTQMLRANLDWKLSRKWQWQLSAINRKLSFNGIGLANRPQFSVESKSQTIATYLYTRFWTRYRGGGFFSLEHVDLDAHDSLVSQPSKEKLYPKFGAMISLSF